MVADPGFFAWLEENGAALLERSPAALLQAVRRSVEIKAAIVGEDETDRSGRRAVLNFGHTFGHAIEHAAGYGDWLHGEAVAAGMCMAARLSVAEGGLAARDNDRLARLLARLGLPTHAGNLDAGALKTAMLTDKKNARGRIRLVLPRSLGDVRLTGAFSMTALDAVLRGSAP